LSFSETGAVRAVSLGRHVMAAHGVERIVAAIVEIDQRKRGRGGRRGTRGIKKDNWGRAFKRRSRFAEKGRGRVLGGGGGWVMERRAIRTDQGNGGVRGGAGRSSLGEAESLT